MGSKEEFERITKLKNWWDLQEYKALLKLCISSADELGLDYQSEKLGALVTTVDRGLESLWSDIRPPICESEWHAESHSSHSTCPSCGKSWTIDKVLKDENERLKEENRQLWLIVNPSEVKDTYVPKCAVCGLDATCVGNYEDSALGFACDSCCGHGNEGGWCGHIAELPGIIKDLGNKNDLADVYEDAIRKANEGDCDDIEDIYADLKKEDKENES